MILVDTSAWIDFFSARPPFADRVDGLLETREAAVCGPVVTELRRGFRSDKDRSAVLPLLGACVFLEQPPHLWEEAGDLGVFAGRKGVTAKSLDLLIAVYAISHAVPLLTKDQDFYRLQKAGIPLLLTE